MFMFQAFATSTGSDEFVEGDASSKYFIPSSAQ
jgi:hypothetical protein